MAAVLQLDPYEPHDLDLEIARPRHPARAYRQPRPRPARRQRRAVYRRRRLVAALAGLGLVLTVARAGAALEGPTLATPERLPHVHTTIVQPGDSLWSIARALAPRRDPRVVVDALASARGTSAVVPGETVTWLDS